MRTWMERSTFREDERARRGQNQDQLKLTKLSESEDIESYITTFERMMQVHAEEEARWAFRLAPQLTGKAQQAYAAMSAEDATDYQQVKMAILRRYNISEETYRRRFRMARKKEGETFGEMAIRLHDLGKKWMAGCEMAEAVHGDEVADDYVQARRRDLVVKRTMLEERRKEKVMDARRCHACRKEGHIASKLL